MKSSFYLQGGRTMAAPSGYSMVRHRRSGSADSLPESDIIERIEELFKRLEKGEPATDFYAEVKSYNPFAEPGKKRLSQVVPLSSGECSTDELCYHLAFEPKDTDLVAFNSESSKVKIWQRKEEDATPELLKEESIFMPEATSAKSLSGTMIVELAEADKLLADHLRSLVGDAVSAFSARTHELSDVKRVERIYVKIHKTSEI